MSCLTCGGYCYRQGGLWVCGNCGATFSAGGILSAGMLHHSSASQISGASE